MRANWILRLEQVARPVLEAGANRTLSSSMPVQGLLERARFSRLEAISRLLGGIAPWLEAEVPNSEKTLQDEFQRMALASISSLADPKSPDYACWDFGDQPLVDAAFLSLALLRAPTSLFDALDEEDRCRLWQALQKTRKITCGLNNWTLFPAMIETVLGHYWKDRRVTPIKNALNLHQAVYKGDGTYGDGFDYHCDYYNSFVIHPFLLEITDRVTKGDDQLGLSAHTVDIFRDRAMRYAEILERAVSPDGSWPVTGRSVTYRCGAFHLLSLLALRSELPDKLSHGKVRAALHAVMERSLSPEDTFDSAGWLRIGLCGHQPSLGEEYISTGSLYMCSTVFLPLGLNAGHPFWTEPELPWTSKLLWAGGVCPPDVALKAS